MANKKYVSDTKLQYFWNKIKQYVDTSISSITDNNTTYNLSITNNIITLTSSDNTTSTVTLPIYNGEVTT